MRTIFLYSLLSFCVLNMCSSSGMDRHNQLQKNNTHQKNNVDDIDALMIMDFAKQSTTEKVKKSSCSNQCIRFLVYSCMAVNLGAYAFFGSGLKPLEICSFTPKNLGRTIHPPCLVIDPKLISKNEL